MHHAAAARLERQIHHVGAPNRADQALTQETP